MLLLLIDVFIDILGEKYSSALTFCFWLENVSLMRFTVLVKVLFEIIQFRRQKPSLRKEIILHWKML